MKGNDMREIQLSRKTAETDIKLSLSLDKTGKSNIKSGVGFLDHMLTLFARHGGFDLELECVGDTHVDDHHTVEDIGILLGEAFAKCLGDKRGICRYGDVILPMDETLILCAVDISGRAYLSFDVEIPTEKIGTFDTELVCEFFLAFVRNSDFTVHVRMLSGSNSHHIVEGIFKAFGRVLKKAVAIDEANKDAIPSTKGVL